MRQSQQQEDDSTGAQRVVLLDPAPALVDLVERGLDYIAPIVE